MSCAIEALANIHLTARRLISDVQTENVLKLLVLSSLAVAKLVLLSVCFFCVDRKSINDDPTDSPRQTASHLLDLPPFPVLTSLKVLAATRDPSLHLVNRLSSVSSIPALDSVELKCNPPLQILGVIWTVGCRTWLRKLRFRVGWC